MHGEGVLRAVLNTTAPRSDEAGFTLVELVIVLLLSSIVLVAALSSLTSLANAASRNDSVVDREQAVSTVVAQLERDIRSASAISIPAGASPGDQLQLTVPASGGGSTNLLWVYDAAGGTLTRESQVNGAFESNGPTATNISNGSGTAVFTYYAADASDISATSPSNIALCTTAVGIEVKANSSQVGGGTFQETSEVALTTQAQALTVPGDGPCGSD